MGHSQLLSLSHSLIFVFACHAPASLLLFLPHTGMCRSSGGDPECNSVNDNVRAHTRTYTHAHLHPHSHILTHSHAHTRAHAHTHSRIPHTHKHTLIYTWYSNPSFRLGTYTSISNGSDLGVRTNPTPCLTIT